MQYLQFNLNFIRTRGFPSHLLGSQANGRQDGPLLNDNEYNSSDTSVDDSKIQFQNNLRKFKAKCDNELEKLLEKCESRRKISSHDRKILAGSAAGESSTSFTSRNVRRYDSANNNNNNTSNNNANNNNNITTTAKTVDDDENEGGNDTGGVM
jgi:hypothetical protein